MEGLLQRIGLGCGRLRGQWEERNSRRLIEAALEAGITYFDTAPSYGGGASERILGRALRGVRSDVQVCTKIGLAGAAPRGGAKLRGMAVAAARAVLPGRVLNALKPRGKAVPAHADRPRGYGNFELQSVRSSLERSLNALESDHVDCLMLHEPRKTDPTDELAQFLRERVHLGAVKRLGVGTYAGLEELPAFGEVAQFALGPSAFSGGHVRIHIGHGLLRNFDRELFERCAMEERVFDTLPDVEVHLREVEGSSALLLNTMMFGAQIDRILVSTGSAVRLRKFLSSAKTIFDSIEAHRNEKSAAALTAAARRYLTAKAACGNGGRSRHD